MPPKASDPVVIPAMSGIDGKFTCIGNGLLYEGHARESPDTLKMLLSPAGGTDPISDRSRPKAWWTAQASFYALPCPKNATITAIRVLIEACIKTKTLEFPKALKDLESKSNREFKKLNKEVLEKTGGGVAEGPSIPAAKSAAKASSVPKASAPAKTSKTKRVVAAEADAHPKPKKIKTVAAVPVAPRPNAAPNPLPQPPALPPIPDPSANPAAAHAYKTKQTARKTAAGSPKRIPLPPMEDGQIGIAEGRWEILCPHIATGWSDFGDTFELNVARVQGQQRIEASFDFGLAHGYLRSKSVESRSDGGMYAIFEWVGQETGDRVLTPNASYTGFIKFGGGSSRGHITKGKINGLPACGRDVVEFTGEWVGPASRINVRWDDFNEEAYERANRSRWGRGRGRGGW